MSNWQASHPRLKSEAQIELGLTRDRDTQTNTCKASRRERVRNETKRLAELNRARDQAHRRQEAENKLTKQTGSTANTDRSLFQRLSHTFHKFCGKTN